MKSKPKKKKVAKKAAVKKVAPKKEAVKVKVLTFEPDEVLTLKEHISALKDVIKAQKDSANKLRKKNKALQDTITELKKEISTKRDENAFLHSVTTSVGNPEVTKNVVPYSPCSPFVPAPEPPAKHAPLPAVDFPKDDILHTSSKAPNVDKGYAFAPVVPSVSGSQFLGNVCAVRY